MRLRALLHVVSGKGTLPNVTFAGMPALKYLYLSNNAIEVQQRHRRGARGHLQVQRVRAADETAADETNSKGLLVTGGLGELQIGDKSGV